MSLEIENYVVYKRMVEDFENRLSDIEEEKRQRRNINFYELTALAVVDKMINQLKLGSKLDMGIIMDLALQDVLNLMKRDVRAGRLKGKTDVNLWTQENWETFYDFFERFWQKEIKTLKGN